MFICGSMVNKENIPIYWEYRLNYLGMKVQKQKQSVNLSLPLSPALTYTQLCVWVCGSVCLWVCVSGCLCMCREKEEVVNQLG